MKKNKMMRLASALLVAVLLTTSVISGTYAKYVTTNSGSDSARVAKWGVVINVNDDMGVFKTNYKNPGNSEITVQHEGDTEKLVAPGTSGSMSFSIAGTPEVDLQLSVVSNIESTIHLAPGTYNLEAGRFAKGTTQVVTTADYEPIKFYFGEGTTVPTEDSAYIHTLSDLQTQVNLLTKKYEANQTLDKTYTIAWKWAFEQDFTGGTFTVEPYTGAKVADFLDTYLGDEAIPQVEKFDLTITATQID